ncbi:MAG: phosphate acetyltransferase [Candidatus Omnitrophica bacterium]|nr:phosphate acetyltransferase [Candidatus Omnitrophota bacterium]
MSKLQELRERAKKNKKIIVLPEGEDDRVVQAASFIASEGIANVVLLADKDILGNIIKKENISLDGVKVIYPKTDPDRNVIIDAYYDLRKHKLASRDEAEKTLMDNFVFYGAMMARLEKADGFVAGANHTTGDIARAAIQCIKIDKEIGSVSSSFIMEIENCQFGKDGVFVYADCGIVPDPNARQLCGIAIAASDLFKKVFDSEPYVALLSYSTKGSAEGDSINKVREALAKVKEKRPDIKIDGELQVDAALLVEIAEKKCKGSEVAGKANVFVFPDLNSGNIGYKLTQRLANARAVGPILQGIEKPCSDLSRGCSWEDVVDAVAVIALKA